MTKLSLNFELRLDSDQCRECGGEFEVLPTLEEEPICSVCMAKGYRAWRLQKRVTDHHPVPGSKWQQCHARKHKEADCNGPLNCNGACWVGERVEIAALWRAIPVTPIDRSVCHHLDTTITAVGGYTCNRCGQYLFRRAGEIYQPHPDYEVGVAHHWEVDSG